MTKIKQKAITTFLMSGLIFAGLSAGSDYSDGLDFHFWKFILNAVVFGSFMALLFWYSARKNAKQEP